MAQNITLLGASYSDVPAVLLPKTGGGTAQFDDTTDADATAEDILTGKTAYVNGVKLTGTGSGGGGGLVHVGTLPTQTVKLADAAYASWTPSSTAGTIVASVNGGTFVATNIAEHDYYSRVRVYADIQYAEGTATSKGRFRKMVAENWYAITRRASNNANLDSSTRNSNVAESVTNTWIINYYNSGWVASYSSAYGIYTTNVAPTLSSTSAASPTVTVKRPTITAKCNATYFSTAMANAVDQDKSTVTFAYDIYRADGGYDRRTLHMSMMDMWNNGLT